MTRAFPDLDGLRQHRLRAALSITGVLLAVAVTLTAAAVDEGARREAARSIERIGATNIRVEARGTPRNASLTVRDASAISIAVRDAIVSPELTRTVSASGPGGSATLRVSGVTAAFADIHHAQPLSGRLLTPRDDRVAARVCVLGAGAARRLFARRQPVGEYIRLGHEWCHVVGISAQTAFQDDILTTLTSIGGAAAGPELPLTAIWIQAADAAHVAPVAAGVRRLLARTHPDRGAYDVVVAREMLAGREAAQRLFDVLARITAALLFVLGGIGILNVMLTAVLERTPEIGLRRAVGATRRHVLIQFLAESLAIASCGGLAGVVAGFALIGVTARLSGWPMALPAAAALATPALSTVVGLAAGVYPAVRAARLQPVEALTHGAG